MRFSCAYKQLLDEFIKKENIILDGAPPAQVLLGRDTRPSGGDLLEAAKQVLLHSCFVYLFCMLLLRSTL